MTPYYKEEGVTIYHGDCHELVYRISDRIHSGDFAVVSDPPYGMNNDADSNRFSGGSFERVPCRAHKNIHGDDAPFDATPWIEFPKVCLWGANHFGRQLPRGTTLIWLKRHPELYGSFLSDAEIAWCKGGHGIYCYYKQFPPPIRAIEAGGDPCFPNTPHPNQKPIGLMAWSIERAGVGKETIIDPFMGSGTTLRAAKDLGRKAIGIEIEEKYCEIAARRLQQEVLKL